ncbi:tryptophan aminotransferase-related protein 4-like [Ipomoea triloba]|uniref:tryptophan aminotransferase-related protein 4-like n=1 Tax=Ipomoea triloba TaxID=35885 RepID=UPI00125E8FA0|nr:tryptophan aminotransferase-related protein 4-like [Ipomoea triloba]
MGEAMQGFAYAICLLLSVLLNILLVGNILYGGDGEWRLRLPNGELKWSQDAAAAAEAVAALQCSGHGIAFLDGEIGDDGVTPVCECHTCYSGSDCSLLLPDCFADADSGDPLFLEPFWVQNAASSAVVVSGWHRMSYSFPDSSIFSQQLENHIRKVHAIARNAITDGKYIVFGVGSTQLCNAAVYALSLENSSSLSPAKVVAKIPFYPLYKMQTEYFETKNYEFEGDPSLLRNDTDAAGNVIEFVTSPNNPDGHLRAPVVGGPFARTIYDRAYYWPHFTAIPAAADEDLSIFTISKLTGHAGSRFGWAIVKDKSVYENMVAYIRTAELGISKETQLRALSLLKTVVQGDGRGIFNFSYEKMKNRWERLSQIISQSRRFTLQEISPNYCNFFEKIRGPSPAYAWVKCLREEETDCGAVLEAAKIIGRAGSMFSAEDRYVRLSLLKRDDDFEQLLARLRELVAIEDGAKTM